MLDLIYDLAPGEGPGCIDGHLLVLVYDRTDRVSSLVSDRLYNRVVRLDDSSEFLYSAITTSREEGDAFAFVPAASLPALLHYVGGRLNDAAYGVDDCLDFFDEFVLANRCSKKKIK